MDTSKFKTSHPLLFGLSMLAGGGVIIMILVLAYGVIAGSEANSSALGLFFLLGLALFISGVVGWAAVVRPFDHFDDINQPLEDDHGHGHAAHDDAHAAEHVTLVETTDKAITPAHH